MHHKLREFRKFIFRLAMVLAYTFSVSVLSDVVLDLQNSPPGISFNLYSQCSQFSGVVEITVGEFDEIHNDDEMESKETVPSPNLQPKKGALKINAIPKNKPVAKQNLVSGKYDSVYGFCAPELK